MIVRDEERQIGACLESIRDHVEEIVVVDTGSVDKTRQIAAKFADRLEVYLGCNDPETGLIEDFSDARNFSFSLATKRWTMWVDGDDEVVGADKLKSLTDHFDNISPLIPTCIQLPYHYAHDEFGNTTCLHRRERIVRPREAFEWSYPVHELLTPVTTVSMARVNEIKVIHKKSWSSEPGRNLRILESANDGSARSLFYLGLEYGSVGRIHDSIRTLNEYISVSGWDDEKCVALLRLVDMYHRLGSWDEAEDAASMAVSLKGEWSEPLFALGRTYHLMASAGINPAVNWRRSVDRIMEGLQKPPTETPLSVNLAERSIDIHRFLNVSMGQIGDIKGALWSVREALLSSPGDENLLHNEKVYESQ